MLVCCAGVATTMRRMLGGTSTMHRFESPVLPVAAASGSGCPRSIAYLKATLPA